MNESRVPPFTAPAPPCSRCGGIYELSVRLADGTVLRGHVPGGPTCVPRAPVWDKRARRAMLAGR